MKRILSVLVLLGIWSAASASDIWTIPAENISGDYYGISVANGGIGIVPWNEPFSINRVVMNHVFDTDGFHGVSRAVRAINPFIISMSVDGAAVGKGNVKDMKQELDMKKAVTYGYQGAMFPWESDFAGEEACPTFALTGLLEHHITADIAVAAWNYYSMTGDKDWLRDSGWKQEPLLRYWCGRPASGSNQRFLRPRTY